MAATRTLTEVSNLFQRLLQTFPEGISYCFGYGSGVFAQSGANAQSARMIDLIFTVPNPNEWHRLNIEKNPKHYSFLRWGGHRLVASYQQHWGAKVYFNTLVPIPSDNVVIKYGVVSQSDLVADLLDWSELYLAGRLHKPVKTVISSSDAELTSALNQNLHSAVHAALLLLPEHFTETQLYNTITGISYIGDFRMTFGEDKNKVNNIVTPMVDNFRKLYTPVFNTLNDYMEIQETGICCQDCGQPAKLHHLNQLPREPQRALVRYWNRGSGNLRQDSEDVLRAVSHDNDCDLILSRCLADIVWRSSVRQSLKGIATAGIIKSIKYSSAKVKKMFKSI